MNTNVTNTGAENTDPDKDQDVNELNEEDQIEAEARKAEADAEFELLKQRATDLGVEFSPNIGPDTLSKRITKFIEDKQAADAAEAAKQKVAETNGLSDAAKARKEATKLVRVRIACMNPAKKEYQGDMFTVGNSVIGTLTKFIPFNTAWHVPQIILNVMKEKHFQTFYYEKTEKGKVKRSRLARTYAIEYLPDLAPSELNQMKQRALASEAING